MKHLKLFESINEDPTIDIENLFVDLKDQHYIIDISKNKCVNIVDDHQTEFRAYGVRLHQMTGYEPHAKETFIVTIQKMIPRDRFKGSSIEYRFIDSEKIPDEFNTGEIMETLLFAESYSKAEMPFKFKWVFDGIIYYNSIKLLPNKEVFEIIIGFGK